MPGTQVRMANGTTRAINDLDEGDFVWANDPETGSRVREVTDVRSNEGWKHLITVTVDVDGKEGGKTSTITSTAGHPYWLPDAGRWKKAGELEPGMWLRTSAGTWVQVTAVNDTYRTQRVYNLTVDAAHTYYVLSGATPVLVHNCGSGDDDDLVTVYRGTDQGLENMIAEESGHLMSDAARSTYAGTGSMEEAMKASQQAHADAVQAWGSLDNYVHGAFGTEMAQIGPRSMMSFTTDINVARSFGGTFYAARIPRNQMILQTLPGAGEAEVLVPHMIAVTRL